MRNIEEFLVQYYITFTKLLSFGHRLVELTIAGLVELQTSLSSCSINVPIDQEQFELYLRFLQCLFDLIVRNI